MSDLTWENLVAASGCEIDRLRQNIANQISEIASLEAQLETCEGGSFTRTWSEIQEQVHQTAVKKGWYSQGERNLGELIALIHSELSEVLEAMRRGNPPSEHIEGYSAVEEELADVIIRVMDLSCYQGYRVGEAVIAKMAFNETRIEKHGGKLF